MTAALRNPITPWENDIWRPEMLFDGQTVVCIASGPSLTAETCETVRQARAAGRCAAIVVNSSCRLAPWADVLFFTDSGWYEPRRDLVRDWAGLVVSMSRLAKRELPQKVKRVKGCGDPSWPPRREGMPKCPGFPDPGGPYLHQGRNSGNTAVSLAIAMGARRVLMAGYDCRIVNGREHHHDEYKGGRDATIYDLEFRHAFRGWNEAARHSGVEIINCTPGSAIEEFPFAVLEDVLNEAPA